MPDAADLAIRNLERLIAKDPLLRDILHPNLPGPKSRTRFSPDVDVYETETGWQVLVELPGVAKDSVTVQLEGARLIVSGKKPAHAPEGGTSKVTERSSGPFSREFLLPFEVSGNEIKARLDNGLLTVSMPRKGKHARRKVDIE